eukprot:350839-Chlamydomonas_euryale.AAC.4
MLVTPLCSPLPHTHILRFRLSNQVRRYAASFPLLAPSLPLPTPTPCASGRAPTGSAAASSQLVTPRLLR